MAGTRGTEADDDDDDDDRFEAETGRSTHESTNCHAAITMLVDCILRPSVCQLAPERSFA
jgi:hypothetical protein